MGLFQGIFPQIHHNNITVLIDLTKTNLTNNGFLFSNILVWPASSDKWKALNLDTKIKADFAENTGNIQRLSNVSEKRYKNMQQNENQLETVATYF